MQISHYCSLVAAWLRAPALAFFSLFFSVVAHATESYTFGVVPQFDQRKLFAIWKPILDEVARRSGIELRLVATLTVPEFERELRRGTFDVVYANPYQILREFSRQAYVPLVRDSVPVRGVVVVRKDSPIQSPGQLDGQTLAVPSLNAIGASLLIRADLEQLFKAKVQPIGVKTHSSVYLHVVNGLTPAGGGIEKTLNEQESAVRNQLRVVYTTRDVPSHPVASHPRVPAAARERIQRAFLELASDSAGRRLLGEVPFIELVSASPRDYEPMSRWNLERYWIE